MNYPLDKIKDYVYLLYNLENVFSLNLNEIIESEFENAFEILEKLGIIEYIKREYKIDYKKPKLEILKNNSLFKGAYSPSENKIIFSKKSIKEEIDDQLKIFKLQKTKRYINDIQGIKYLNKSYNLIFLYPFYINEENIRKAIAKAIIRSTMFHEIWHFIDFSILHKLKKDSTIKDREYLLAILNNPNNRELRASVFEVVMYYLVNGFHKDEKEYITASSNILICTHIYGNYIEKININRIISYELGFCYGNTVVAKYKSSLEENIYNIIDDIIHLDKERAINVIKLYGDNLKKRLYGWI